MSIPAALLCALAAWCLALWFSALAWALLDRIRIWQSTRDLDAELDAFWLDEGMA